MALQKTKKDVRIRRTPVDFKAGSYHVRSSYTSAVETPLDDVVLPEGQVAVVSPDARAIDVLVDWRARWRWDIPWISEYDVARYVHREKSLFWHICGIGLEMIYKKAHIAIVYGLPEIIR